MQTGLILDNFPTPPELDTAVSAATLEAVASGELPDLFRLHTPGRVVAFGRQDTHAEGFPRAVAACRVEGFTPVIRLAGGRAAVFHEQTLAFSWQTRTEQPKLGIKDRFEFITSVLTGALHTLNVPAVVGEIAGEYCPGAYSIHIGGRKVIGVGQRLIAGAAHVGGVIVVGDADAINQVLTPVYAALGLMFDPTVTGALVDSSTVATSGLTRSIIGRLGEFVDLSERALPSDLIGRATKRLSNHRPPDH